MSDASEIKRARGPIAWMAGNSVAANLLMAMLLIGGGITSCRIKQEVFPEFDLDIVTISVPYPGASPAEIEQGILLSIEEEVRGLDGVKKVHSSANEGVGSVTVELQLGTDRQRAVSDVKNAVDRIQSFPEEAEKPRVTIPARRMHVVDVIVYGDVGEDVLRETTERVRDHFLQDRGITLAELDSARPYEISIDVPQETLRAYNLTLGEISERIRNTSIELPGGGIKTQGGEILLRMSERRDFGKEFANVPIVTRPDGTEVRLGDIASIRDGFADVDIESTYNDQPAMTIRVYRVGKETPLSVSDNVHQQVESITEVLPPGTHITTWNDNSDVYRQRMSLLLKNMGIGLILVLVLLSVFLEARLAFWVTMGIPVSFLGGLLFLPLFGVSINMISMFAFIVALGIVVDDAIVVGENIYDYHQRGMPFGKAAARAAQDVAMPVTFSILTNIAAFLPMFFVPGAMGKIFMVIPAVVVLVFIASLVESLFILPAHLSHQRDRKKHGPSAWLHNRQQRFSHAFMRFVKDRYGPFLGAILNHRYVTIAVGIAVLIITIGIVKSGMLGITMFPKAEADIAVANVSLPYGSAIERTREVEQTILKAGLRVAETLGRDQQILGYKATIGGGGSNQMGPGPRASGQAGSHLLTVEFLLTDPDTRVISTDEFTKLWRKETGALAGLNSLQFVSDSGGPGSGASLTIELSHRDLDVLEQASEELAADLRFFPNVKDIDDGFAPGKRQVDFKIRPEGEALGLTAMGVARQVRDAFYGAEVTRQQRGRNEMKIMVRLPEEQRVSEYDLEEFIVRNRDGKEAMLREVVDMERGRSYTVIDRREGRRIVTVTADVDPPSQSNLVLNKVKQTKLPELAAKYPGLTFSFEGKQADMKDSMSSLGVGFIFAMIAIYGLLAIPFKSYLQPLIIMVSIPFGLVGAVLGHLIMGYSLSLMSMFGLVALSGVVVNDSLILIEFANRKRAEGLSAKDAVREAGVRRFRPIMLTTLTTFGGLAPMIFEQSRQAQFLIPMALSLGYGILFATVITLILVPSLYVALDDATRLSTWLRDE